MRKRKCLILVSNNESDKFFIKEIKEIGKEKSFTVLINDDFKTIDETFDFVFCIRYQRIVPKKYIDMVKNGIYVFHSSDLPKGKAWAPLYYSIVNKEKDYVLTMLKINEKVDAGEIIAKAYFKKRKGENGDSLRKVSEIATIKTINKVIDDLLSFILKGQRQKGKGSYYKRRYPSDSEVKQGSTLEKIHYHCLAVTDEYPAFYRYGNKKYIVSIRPESLEDVNENNIKIVTFYKKHGEYSS